MFDLQTNSKDKNETEEILDTAREHERAVGQCPGEKRKDMEILNSHFPDITEMLTSSSQHTKKNLEQSPCHETLTPPQNSLKSGRTSDKQTKSTC